MTEQYPSPYAISISFPITAILGADGTSFNALSVFLYFQGFSWENRARIGSFWEYMLDPYLVVVIPGDFGWSCLLGADPSIFEGSLYC